MTVLFVILLIINYLVAIGLLFMIANDDVWNAIVRDMKFGKDLTEQQEITKHSALTRKFFGWLLLVPGFGIIVIISGLKRM